MPIVQRTLSRQKDIKPRKAHFIIERYSGVNLKKDGGVGFFSFFQNVNFMPYISFRIFTTLNSEG